MQKALYILVLACCVYELIIWLPVKYFMKLREKRYGANVATICVLLIVVLELSKLWK